MKHPLLLSELFLSLSIIVSAAVMGKPLDSFDDVDDVVDAVKSCGDHQECVLRHLCNDNGTIITDGRAIIDMRTASFSKESNQGCQWSEVCCSAGDKIVNSVEEYVSRGCGYSNPKGLQLTLQNTEQSEAQFGEFPWMISISEQICKNGVCTWKAQGGGSLLAPNVVLTTGHKIMNSSTDSLRVRAGEWDNLSTAEPYAHQDRQVARMILHPRFNRQVGFYDAALLILKTPFKLSPHIDTICLPAATDNFAHSRCIVTGWGRKTIDDPNYPNLLKKIELPYIERAKCQQQLRRTRLGRYFQLHSSFTCAGGEKDRDACLGDGGSPLVCPSKQGDPHHFVLAGIVSWGLECGQENVPGVYANVQALRPWIDQQLELIQ